jgi:drug/metabolite transporter (DMT)-like permease
MAFLPSPTMNSKWKAHAALLGANLIYGANYSLAKEVMPQYIGPSGMIVMRVLGAILLFGLFWSFNPEIPKKEDICRFLLCAMTGVAVNQIMFFEGLNLTTPIQASIILTANPILVLIAAAIIAKERITWAKSIGILLGLIGAAILILRRDNTAVGNNVMLGNFFIFVNAASYSIYLVLVRKLMRTYRVITVMFWIFLPGLFLVLPFGWQEFSIVEWTTIPANALLILGFIIVGTTFLAYLLNAYALVTVSASVVSAYVYLQPFLAAAIAISLSQDRLDLHMIVSALLVFAGVYLVSKLPASARSESGK